MKHCGVKAGDKVGVVGLGGLGHMAVKIAKAMGAHVTVFTTSKDKEPDQHGVIGSLAGSGAGSPERGIPDGRVRGSSKRPELQTPIGSLTVHRPNRSALLETPVPPETPYSRRQMMSGVTVGDALAVEQSFASAGADSNLRRFARADVPMIKHHLELAQQMRAAVGGS